MMHATLTCQTNTEGEVEKYKKRGNKREEIGKMKRGRKDEEQANGKGRRQDTGDKDR